MPVASHQLLVDTQSTQSPSYLRPTGFDTERRADPVADAGVGIGLALMLAGLRWQLMKDPQVTQSVQSFSGQCGVTDTAQSYLYHLGRDGLDQSARAIPPKNWEWRTPPGVPSYQIKVQQGWGKDGLAYRVELTGPDNKPNAFFLSAVEVTQKGLKVPVASVPLATNGRSLGLAELSLRVDSAGLNEFEIKHTDAEGKIKILKLKPTSCNLDITGSQLLRMNAGKAADARYWVEAHLAKSAQSQRGQLIPGLLDLLPHIQPGASEQYLNHGSKALAALTQPLNLLKAAGVDFSALPQLKNRAEAKNWLYRALQDAVRQGKIQPKDLVNPYRLNYGIPALAALMPDPVSRTNTAATARSATVPVAWVGAKTPQGKSQQAPIISANDGKLYYLRGKNTSYALPGKTLPQASAAARELIRGGKAHDLTALPSQAPTPLRRWVGAKTPDGMSVQGQLVFWRNESGQMQYGLMGTKNRLYPLRNANGQAPRNTLEAAQRARELIRHGAATHLYGLLDRPATPGNSMSTRGRVRGIEQLHTRVDWRRVKEVVHQQRWLVTQLPNGKLFLAPAPIPGAKAGTLAQVLQALAAALKVPINTVQHSPQTLPLLGQNRLGHVVEAREF